jgi:signal peptidase II
MKNALIFLLIVISDQATKFVAVICLDWQTNTGISFGIFPKFPLWVFFVLIILMLFFKMLFRKEYNLAWTLFMAGMIGNLIDRVRHSFVIDWIPFPFPFIEKLYSNIADIALVMGFLCFVFNDYINSTKEVEQEQSQEAE